jgi:hypothetical protein
MKLFAVLYFGFFVVSLPAVVIAALKGRWWLGMLGYLGFAATVMGVSESPLLPFWLWVAVWAVGLTLLLVGVIPQARSASWWDRRPATELTSATRISLVAGSVVLPLIWMGWLITWGFGLLPLGPIFG